MGGNELGRARTDIGVVAQNVVMRDGQGRVTVELCRALVQLGHSVTVYAHRVEPSLAEAADTVIIPVVAAPQLVDDIAFLVRATKAVRRARHDIVVTIGPTAIPSTTRWLYHSQFSHRGWRATWTPSSRPPFTHRVHATVAGRLERWCARRATAVIATTAQLGRETVERDDRTVLVASLGVDTAEFIPADADRQAAARSALGVPADAVVLGFLGGFSTGRKGLAGLLDAIAYPTPAAVHLVVAGAGPADDVRARANALGIASHVTVAGFADPHTVLAGSDIVVVPSTYEPFSLVALEAVACELPVVITACAGAAAIVEPGAIVVPSGDAAALRTAIDRLTADADLRDDLGRAGRAAVAPLTWEAAMHHLAVLVTDGDTAARTTLPIVGVQ